MILWIIRQILSLKSVLTGRANPHQLAWGFALGLAIGLVPKGNLVSILLIGLLVSVRVNHGMATLAAVGFSFLASRFDPWTHQLGVAVLQSPEARPLLERMWQWPLVPWTSLNNTVVMGSTLAAAAALLPSYVLTLPIFQLMAPRAKPQDGGDGAPPANAAAAVVAAGEEPVIAVLITAGCEEEGDAIAEVVVADPVETQIDVIRVIPADGDEAADDGDGSATGGPMNEALGYLLRRLRDTRQEKAA